MSLRRKALAISAILAVLLIVIFFIISQLIIMRSFSRLETREMSQHVDRVTRALQKEMESLNITNNDWSAWDDTYEFIVDHNEEYIEANLSTSTWIALDTNVVLFVDEHGTIVHGQAIDLVEQEEIPIPPTLLEHLDRGVLLAHEDTSSYLTGWINLTDGLLMVTSRPIITNDYQGPIHGGLIMGRFVTDERIAALSDLVHVDVSFWDYDDPHLPAEVHTAHTGEDVAFMQPGGDDLFIGYSVLYDIYGQPAQVVRVEMPRNIYRQGASSLYYLFTGIGLVTLVFTGMVLFLLERTVLVRLAKMGDVIGKIRATNDISLGVPTDGRDEITALGYGFNDLLGALSKSQHELLEARDELELRVVERTAQLEQSNRQLQEEMIERKRAQQDAVTAHEQTLEALKVKTQILANVSHDARTPLGIIILRSQILQKRLVAALGDKERQMFDAILISATQLTRFFENLLIESRADAKTIELKYTEFKPAELLDEVKSMMCLMTERKGLTLATEIGNGVPPVLSGDVEHLKRILINLSDNAIKFTDQGTVTLRIDCLDGTHWQLKVSDTGIGISPEAQEHIFEAFYQVDGSLTRDVNRGVGLGLAIVKELVALMNADIAVQSELGKGTNFTISFPLQPKSMKVTHEQ